MSAGLREVERGSIRAFVQRCADQGLLSGKVLDYGCGRQPYRDIVEAAAGEYHGFDSPRNPGSVITEATDLLNMVDFPDPWEWDAILCTQVIQYAWWKGSDPYTGGRKIGFLNSFKDWMELGGHLVLTGPTNWPIVEKEDRVRFTAEGIAEELTDAGFHDLEVGYRAEVHFEGEAWPLGWWAVATA